MKKGHSNSSHFKWFLSFLTWLLSDHALELVCLSLLSTTTNSTCMSAVELITHYLYLYVLLQHAFFKRDENEISPYSWNITGTYKGNFWVIVTLTHSMFYLLL
jgi:hypothetical protein